MSHTHKDTVGKRKTSKAHPIDTRKHYKDGSHERKVYKRNKNK